MIQLKKNVKRKVTDKNKEINFPFANGRLGD